jgi:hypothetical protein
VSAVADVRPAVDVRRFSTGAGAVGLAIPLVALAARNAGYFPTSWGWSALVFAWCVLVTVIVAREVTATALELAFLSSVAAVAGWIWLSAVWSDSVPATVLEGERALVYVAFVAALIALGRHIAPDALAGGVLLAVSMICAYSLATRLFPGGLGTFDAIGGYRLSTPVGYWNGLGLFAAIGALLAAGFVARGRTVGARAASAASLVILLPTLYFTFSRGSWLALALATVFLIALDPRRLHTCVVLLVSAPAPAVAVLAASHSHALTTVGADLGTATREGHRLAALVAGLAIVAAALGAALWLVERRVSAPRAMRLAFALALAAATVAALGLASDRWGAPWSMASRGWHAFTSAPPATGANLNNRLFQLSGSGRILTWHSALHEFTSSPVGGRGAGTFQTWWYAHRAKADQVRDAHSLYLETLGEIGVVGLVLLVAALALPFAGAWRTRRDPLVPFAAAALVAWLLHAGVDWDWELPGVTLCALACAVACLGTGRRHELRRMGRAALGAAAVGVAGFGLVAAIGNQALASSRSALDSGNYAKADSEARRAQHWAPWAADAWVLRGQIQALSQQPAQARKAFRAALDRDPRDYLAWYGLAGVERGAARRAAVAQVIRLNPQSDEAAEMRKLLAGT